MYDRLHIIPSKGKYRVKKAGKKKALKILNYSEQAFHYAKGITPYVVVYNNDGSIKFIDN